MSTIPPELEKLTKIDKSQVTPSKLLANGPYIDEFMNGFKCENCGKCEEIGLMVVDYADIKILASYMSMNEHTFAKKYTMIIGNTTFLMQPCPFYDKENKLCKIHDKQRPKVCRLFPLFTVICTDHLYHLGVKTTCQPAVKYLKEFEEKKWSEEVTVL